MKLNIGSQIKCLRREKDITQEELAAVLGVSYQSVSRWENNACYPDMELLPVIAAFFGITVDRLLGVDEIVEKENVAKYLEQFRKMLSQGRIYDCIDIARKGIAEYPNNFELLNKLMYALFLAGDSDGNILEWKENMQKYDAEIVLLGERIAKYCPDQNIRLEATGRLAFQHCEMGRKEIGRALYETLPSERYCKESQIWWGLAEDEKQSFAYNRIREGYEAMCHGIYLLIDGRLLPDEELLKVCEKELVLEEVVWDEQESVWYWGKARLYCAMAAISVRLKKYEQVYSYLRKAAEFAEKFDLRPEDICTSSILFGEQVQKRDDYETTDTRTLSEIMRDKWLASEEYDVIRQTVEFKNIIKQLSKN